MTEPTRSKRKRAQEPGEPERPDTLVFQEKIDTCLDIMRSEQWIRGKTPRALSEVHGGSIDVWHRASSAAAAVRRRELPDDEVQAQVEALMHDLTEMGRESGDISGAVAAARLLLDSRGMLKQKHEHEMRGRVVPSAEMFSAALEHPGFTQWLIEQGWQPPAKALLTQGETVE